MINWDDMGPGEIIWHYVKLCLKTAGITLLVILGLFLIVSFIF